MLVFGRKSRANFIQKGAVPTCRILFLKQGPKLSALPETIGNNYWKNCQRWTIYTLFESQTTLTTKNAIAVLNPDGEKLGYVRSGLAKELVAYMELYPDSVLIGEILEITGDEVGKNYGCNIEISIIRSCDKSLKPSSQTDITKDLYRSKASTLSNDSIAFWVVGAIGLFISLGGFILAWPIGVILFILDLVFFGFGVHYWKLASKLGRIADNDCTIENTNVKRTGEKTIRPFIAIAIIVAFLIAVLVIGYAIHMICFPPSP